MTGVVNGKDVLMLIRKDSDYVPFICAQELSFDPTISLLNVTTKGDGYWDKFKASSAGYTINMAGVTTFANQSAFGAFDVLKHQLEFVEIDYKMVFTDKEDLNTKYLLGRAIIETGNISGNAGSLSKASFSLRGTGKPNLLDCDSRIGEIIVTQVEDDQYSVQLDFVEGDPALFYYTIDSGDEQQTTSNPFIIEGIIVGMHKIIVTPACAEDKRGIESETIFTRIAGGGDIDYDPLESFMIDNIEATSFVVRWTFPEDAISANLTLINTVTGYQLQFDNITTEGGYLITDLAENTQYQVVGVANYPGDNQSPSVSTTATTAQQPVQNIALTVFNHPNSSTTQVYINGTPVLTTPIGRGQTGVTFIPPLSGATVQVDIYNYSLFTSRTVSVTTQPNGTQSVSGLGNGARSATFTGISADIAGIVINIT